MANVTIKPAAPDDREWVRATLLEEWGSARVVSRRRLFEADKLSGYIALLDDKPVGLATYNISGKDCEIVTLHSLEERNGIGSALIESVKEHAKRSGCRRVWLITTNDNTNALRFYQRRGFVVKAVYPDAIAESRVLKPEIPLVGHDGIPIRDEIELEIIL